MPFLGLMLVSTHRDALIVAKSEAFADGQAHGRATAPKPIDRQPMINSLQGQLDAAVELKDGYARTIEKQKQTIAELTPDAEKWRKRKEADRKRQQKKREDEAAKKTAPKRAAKKTSAKRA